MADEKNDNQTGQQLSSFYEKLLGGLKQGAKNEIDAIFYIGLAVLMWISDFFLLGTFKGFVLQFPQDFASVQFLSAVAISVILALIFGWNNRKLIMPITVFSTVFFYLMFKGAVLFAPLHFILIALIVGF